MKLVKLTAAAILLATLHPQRLASPSDWRWAGHVQWTEPPGSPDEGAQRSLEFSALNGPSRCRYAIRYASSDPLEKIAATFESTLTQDPSASVELMIPLRVRNTVRPQVLVRRSRSNWGDYRLYGVADDSVVELWGIAHRDWACVQWVASRGALDHFVVYDRWQPERAWPRRRGHPGHRWELREVYRFDPKSGAWKVASEKWEEYEIGRPLDNSIIHSPADCKFLYPACSGRKGARSRRVEASGDGRTRLRREHWHFPSHQPRPWSLGSASSPFCPHCLTAPCRTGTKPLAQTV
jgi:hypothetical protein